MVSRLDRVSSCKVYGAVPPPLQLQAGVNGPGNASKVNDMPALSPGLSGVASQDTVPLSVGLPNSGLPQTNTCYPHGLTSGRSYIGYGGIYPQATPLQQVALALRQSTSTVTATVSPSTTEARTDPPREVPSLANEKQSQKRKFQELPPDAKGPANLTQKNIQGSEFPMPRELTSHVGLREISVVQDAKKFVQPSYSGMPPPKSSPPPPPPPKFNSTPNMPLPPQPKFDSTPKVLPPPPPKFDSSPKVHKDNQGPRRSKPETVPDTLIKLMEYGDDDDDEDNNDLGETAKPKPFWAV